MISCGQITVELAWEAGLDVLRLETGVRQIAALRFYQRAGYAKYLRERTNEPSPVAMAEVVVPSDLARFIKGGPRALEAAQRALDYLFSQAQDQFGPRGTGSRPRPFARRPLSSSGGRGQARL
ncbi:MAG TPA: hypothetical protein VE687_20250 [Stellaceae bacterium]|nr:hypothetical protein [Stellaceae bacterium]